MQVTIKSQTMLKLKPRKTIDDYLKLPENVRAELIGGELFMTPSPRFSHQDVAAKLLLHLTGFVEAQGLGKVAIAPLDVHLPSQDIVQPDVMFIRKSNAAIIQDWVRGAPDLVIEVLSPDSNERDRIVKRELYARNGVPEYWIADPATGTVEVLVSRNGSYESHGYFEAGDNLDSPALPGLALPVNAIFQKR